MGINKLHKRVCLVKFDNISGDILTIFTNNIMVLQKLSDKTDVEYFDVDSLEILYKIRNKIHNGAVLLSHPLSGSIKPNENPYKSLIIEDKEAGLDYKSLEIIENSINTFLKFKTIGDKVCSDQNADKDYALIDYSLISSCL